jgi:hypothetical protein
MLELNFITKGSESLDFTNVEKEPNLRDFSIFILLINHKVRTSASSTLLYFFN